MGTIRQVTDERAFHGYDPRDDGTGPAEIYWDVAATAQSAHVIATSGEVTYETVLAFYEAMGPVVAQPTGIDDPQLEQLLTILDLDPSTCERIPTFVAEETEESRCTHEETIVYAGAFAERRPFIRYRSDARQEQREDRTWLGANILCESDRNGDGRCVPADGERQLGKIRGYIDGDGTEDESGVVYIDDTACRCYIELWGFEGPGLGDPSALYDLVFG